MSQLANQWIDLFRAGDYGGKGSFTEQDLQQIVDNYKPDFHEAPACIGHPENDAPAYGWWQQVRRVGNLLQGKLKPNVDPTFEEAVKTGRFDKRSIALYKGENGFSLRHVAFLGAQPPECKGLAALKFGERDKSAVEIEFQEESQMPETPEEAQKRTFMEGLAALFNIGKPGVAPAAVVPGANFSEADVKRFVSEAVTVAVAPLQQQLDAQKTTFSESQTAQQKAEAKNRVDASILRVKAKGAWVPAFDKAGLPLIFSALADSVVTIEFGEGAEKKSESALERFTAFMEGLGQIVPNTPVYTGQKAASTATSKVGRINETARVTADPNSIQFAEAIAEYQEKHNVDYTTAMNKVALAHPELTVVGGSSAGLV